MNTLYQYYYVLSPTEAEELLWCRFINVSGIPGKNIASDLHMEHLNRVLKDSIRQPTPEYITQAGKAIGTLAPVVPSGTHCPTMFEKDFKMIAKELLTNTQHFPKVGRYYRSFKLVKGSSLHRTPLSVIRKWMKNKI